jgi:hypothetical protein
VVLFWNEWRPGASRTQVNHWLWWEVVRILLVYERRRTSSGTLHRDGKQPLPGSLSGRSGTSQIRNVSLVSVAYSLLMRSLHQTSLHGLGGRWRPSAKPVVQSKPRRCERQVDWIVARLSMHR